MFFRRNAIHLILTASLAAPLSIGVGACNSNSGPKVAAVKAGDMPDGGDWTGVYYSQTYGYLHLIKEGDTVSGKWRNTAGDAWGEMSGKVTGNLLKYEWKEHNIGMVGPSATTSGRGYFLYSSPKAGEAHELPGEWGLKTDETGQTWKAVKQANMQPNPDSVMPDEIEGRSRAAAGTKTISPSPSRLPTTATATTSQAATTTCPRLSAIDVHGGKSSQPGASVRRAADFRARGTRSHGRVHRPARRAGSFALKKHLGSLARKQEAALPEVSEPEAFRHFVRLSQWNFSIDTQFYPARLVHHEVQPQGERVGGAPRRICQAPSGHARAPRPGRARAHGSTPGAARRNRRHGRL